jgi:hypothetical protein
VKLFERSGGVPADVLARADLPRGERLLAHAPAQDGSWVLGTRLRLTLVHPDRVTHIPWESVEDAAWDKEASRLKVTEIGEYGEQRPAHSFDMDDPSRLLQLVRERVTASIVLQRRVPVRGRQGLTIIGRRSPSGGPVAWMHAYDAGLDPLDPDVSAVADEALVAAQAEVGETEPHPI